MSYIDKIKLNNITYDIGQSTSSGGGYIEVDPNTFTIDEAYKYYNNGINRFRIKQSGGLDGKVTSISEIIVLTFLSVSEPNSGYNIISICGKIDINDNIYPYIFGGEFSSGQLLFDQDNYIIKYEIAYLDEDNNILAKGFNVKDSNSNNYITIGADTSTETISFNSMSTHPITLSSRYGLNVADPTSNLNIANKQYVDTAVANVGVPEDLESRIAALESQISSLQSTVNSLNSFLNTNMRNMLTTIYNG